MEQQIVVFFCLQRLVVKISPAFLLLIYFLGRKTSIAHVGYLKNIFVLLEIFSVSNLIHLGYSLILDY